MSLLSRFRAINESDKSIAVEKLITGSTPEFDFFLLIVLSILMATFGLLIDSTAVVIGSMLIAPLLYPVLSVSLGMVMSDYRLISRSFYTIFKSILLGVGAAAIATLIFAPEEMETTPEILARTEPSLLYFAVAVIAGIAVSYSLVKPKLSESFPGVVVAVALIPPLAVLGIGIARFDVAIIGGSLLLFFINIIGIMFASMIIFSLLNLYVKRGVAKETIEKEEKRVMKEEEKIERIEKIEKIENKPQSSI